MFKFLSKKKAADKVSSPTKKKKMGIFMIILLFLVLPLGTIGLIVWGISVWKKRKAAKIAAEQSTTTTATGSATLTAN